MNILEIGLTQWNCFGSEHNWHFPFFFFFFILLMCFLFRRRRRRYYMGRWPWLRDYHYFSISEINDILKKRYERGDIRKEDYDKLRKDFSSL